jgi:hypothetical protein
MKRIVRQILMGSAVCTAFDVLPALADPSDVTTAAPDVAMPASGSNTTSGGPTSDNQEVTAVTGPRQVDPYYQPKGIPLGDSAFRLFPNIYGAAGYDDNVFKVHDESFLPVGVPKSGFFSIIDPTMILDYDTSQLKLDLYGDGSWTDYFTNPSLDTVDWDAGLRGRYDISHAAAVTGNASYSALHEAISSANAAGTGQDKPTQYTLFDVSGRGTYQPNRLGFTVGGSFDSYSYLNTPRFGGGFVPEKGRDYDLYKGFAEVGYDFSPGYSAFVRGIYNNDHYRNDPSRSSDGFEGDVGVKLLLSDLVQGQAYVGYLMQSYKAPYKDINGFDYGADLYWYPTELLTLHLAGAHSIVNTSLTGAAGGDDKNVSVDADWEVHRRFHITANAGFDDTDYKHSALISPVEPDREDQTLSFGGGMKWLISHYVWVDGKYTYTNRSSTWRGPLAGSYHDNTFMVGLNLQD